MGLSLQVRAESWPIKGAFAISRGAKTQADVVVVEIADGKFCGRGEAVPYPRYGETVAGTVAEIEQFFAANHGRLSRAALQQAMPAGAARNALDCALWDLAAKRAGKSIWQLAGVVRPAALITAYTLSLDRPEAMAAAARQACRYPLLKIKLGGADGGDAARLQAVRAAVPHARLIVDANEAWRPCELQDLLAAAARAGVEMVEQPLPAEDDEILCEIRPEVVICADESAHTRTALAELAQKYQAVNIKLDKTGGLSEALEMMRMARGLGLQIMVGCMVATSLAMAPAMVVAAGADIVDLDGPLLLAQDRPDGLRYTNGEMQPPEAALWG